MSSRIKIIIGLSPKSFETITKSIISVALLLCVSGYLHAQTLTIRVENAIIGKGNVMVGIFNDKKTFPDTYFRGQKISVSEKTTIIAFNDLPQGQYAVSVYQDSNGNGQLDKNILGIPKEKYGFSNNSDRPDFEKCLFDFNNDKTITIKIK
ncbi:MAG: DUF2141 domain-containing protein [Tannerellaceae bacterium]|jgi:uncharacterized protein (DUF2141 family)|nr:DUF2141 domain-containing protein [Tannerellaceae bacterium]